MKKSIKTGRPGVRADRLKQPAKVVINRLSTGVRGLDEILGGGLPEFSFNIIGGMPGCGKTTLAHQIAFANDAGETGAVFHRARRIRLENAALSATVFFLR